MALTGCSIGGSLGKDVRSQARIFRASGGGAGFLVPEYRSDADCFRETMATRDYPFPKKSGRLFLLVGTSTDFGADASRQSDRHEASGRRHRRAVKVVQIAADEEPGRTELLRDAPPPFGRFPLFLF